MSSILLLAHPTTCTQEQYSDSLKDLVDSRNASADLPSILPELDASKVKQCVVGPNHLAFLMQNGQICRVSFHVNSERTNCSTAKEPSSDEETLHPTTSAKKAAMTAVFSSAAAETSSQNEHTFTISGDTLNSLSGALGRWTTHRVANSSGTTSSGTSSSVLASRTPVTRGRGRIIRATRGRAGSGWISSRAVIPASAVPEELISQAQVVLQGKSRQVIIRELQKTSLDVNLAVNNLLSRDDDDPDDQDEDAYMQETYIPSEDLMSIFEAGIPGDEPFVVQRDAIFSEDIIYNPSYTRAESRLTNTRPATQNENSSSADRDKDFSASRIRDKWWGMLMMEGKDKASANASSPIKIKSSKQADTTHRFGEIEWWTCEQSSEDDLKFAEIVSLYSELVAVTNAGFLHSWKWNDPHPPNVRNNEHTHPRAADMKITNNENISKIAACSIRISILTNSGKLATWLDETLAAVGYRLEIPLQAYPEFKSHLVTQLHFCNLYSCVQLSNGSIYWWGVFPYEQRKKILDKVKTKAKKSAIAGSSQIKPGTLVCIRSCPLYYPGAVGFTTVNGEPRVGKLVDKAWNISEKCRFKIIEPGRSIPTKVEAKENMDVGEGVSNVFKDDQPNVVTPITRKRKYSEDELGCDLLKEEEWCLQDVIFVEEVRNVPVGEVLKVDGAYAMVHFSAHAKSDDKSATDVDSMLRESVIRRKDELQIVKWTTPPKMPECYQKAPKQLIVPGGSKVLTFALDKKGVHAILKTSNGLRYSLFSLASSRPEPGGNIQSEPATFLSKSVPFSSSLLSSGVESIVLMQDPNGCLYPLVKDNVGGIQNPSWSNLSSMTCFVSGLKKTETSQLCISILVLKENELMQNILRCDGDAVQQYLCRIKDDQELIHSAVNSNCDGNRNVVHVCISTCRPASSKSFKMPNQSSNTLESNAGKGELKDEPYEPTMWVPLFDGLTCLDALLKSEVLQSHLFQLLSQKDALGYTPFMSAVRIRAYAAAIKIYNTIISICGSSTSQNKEQFMAMICPNNTDPDMSPLQMLCCNDTCSFTWTGTKHINQDIFECKTCGLVGPLCCCTECAQVCHIGHECKLKKTSPTAYCDCWEKCPCKSLVPGDQSQRVKLLHLLVDETDLSAKPNKKDQHILLFLARTVARQADEQVQYMPNKTHSGESSKQRGGGNNIRSKNRSQTPPSDHELEPPKFAKISLGYILKNWNALKSMIIFGCDQNGSRRANALDDQIISASMLQPEEIGKYLDVQHGTSLLDNFVHKILVKCNSEFLEILVQTLLRQIEQNNSDEVLSVVKRFIRAVIRVYVILSSCAGTTATKKKGLSTAIAQCKRVFLSLNVLAAEEMANIAATIFAPVRMGVVYPSSPFSLGTIPDSSSVSDELFSILPLPERSSVPYSQSTRVRFANTLTVEGGQPEEEEEMEAEEPASQSQLNVTEESIEDTHVHESDMEIDLLAESDSESEESNNGDANETQSNNTTPAATTNRMRRGGNEDHYFSTAETSDGEEDEEVEEDEDDDEDEDDENVGETTENRNTFGTGDGNTAPHALQWAVRSHQNAQSTPTTTTTAHMSGSGMVFIDAAQLRRSGASASGEGVTASSKFSAPSALARTFFVLVREVSDLLSLSADVCSWNGACLPIDEAVTSKSREVTDQHLHTTWKWLWQVMDTTEAQLRFGASLTAVSDPTHPQHPLFDSQTKAKATRGGASSTNILRSWGENRRKKRGAASHTGAASDLPNGRHEYLTYILSLMRSHDNEHGDSLPKVEITSLRHVAYILDAFIYYLRSNQMTESLPSSVDNPKKKSLTKLEQMKENTVEKSGGSTLKSEPDNDDDDESIQNDDLLNTESDVKTFRHRFFKRSDSTLVLGYEPTDPVKTALKDALPLADRPHLLNPGARRDQLFGVVNTTNAESTPDPPINMKFDNAMTKTGEETYFKLSPNVYLGRWRMCLELFGRVFLDDVGSEPCSVLNELGKFDVKEAKFRREMEKLRNIHQKDLYLEMLDRSRPLLLLQSLRQLNSQFGRRVPGAGPLNIHRLKVSFKDEPGEGSGVVRSFYTALSNAFLADENLPNLESIFTGSRGLTHQLRVRSKERERRRNSSGNLQSGMIPRIVRRNERNMEHTAAEIEACNLSVDAPPYIAGSSGSELDDFPSEEDLMENPVPVHKRELGRRIYKKVNAIFPEHVSKVTGMLLELTPTQLIYLLTHDEPFKDKVNEAVDILTAQTRQDSSLNMAKEKMAIEEEQDNSPLFFQPGKPGYYSPRPGINSPERLNCMRNVGRIIGLCLLQNEICPLAFNRHVIKYLLGRKISWHDLAFFDPTLYESLRNLMEEATREDNIDVFSSLDLTYLIQLRTEEGGGSVELIKGGAQVEVAADNVHDYVKKYAEYRMITNSRRALQAIRRGLLDVVPAIHLEGLTAEDFRLLLNGAGDINVQQLLSYTFFSDETGGEGDEKLAKFRKWFWSVVENMTPKQKQDLLYFWTSSPAMPASAEGFQPMPSVTIKPANDHQLPTANTCISRLYVPLYSSKSILRSKFLLAIKTKVFGFV